MKIKPRKIAVQAPLVTYLECEMIEITDPAEKAALDRRCEEAEKVMVNGYAKVKKAKPRKAK